MERNPRERYPLTIRLQRIAVDIAAESELSDRETLLAIRFLTMELADCWAGQPVPLKRFRLLKVLRLVAVIRGLDHCFEASSSTTVTNSLTNGMLKRIVRWRRS